MVNILLDAVNIVICELLLYGPELVLENFNHVSTNILQESIRGLDQLFIFLNVHWFQLSLNLQGFLEFLQKIIHCRLDFDDIRITSYSIVQWLQILQDVSLDYGKFLSYNTFFSFTFSSIHLIKLKIDVLNVIPEDLGR